jgi:Ca2+/Na+ antiporter
MVVAVNYSKTMQGSFVAYACVLLEPVGTTNSISFFMQISTVWHSYILLPIGTSNPEVVVSLNAALIYLVENVTKVVMKAPNVLVLMTPRTNPLVE